MSNETKFTPGPWSWEESCDGDAWLSHQYEHDSDMGYIVVNAHEIPDESNARLISAAPELYAIVDRLVNYRASENDGVPLVDNDRFFDDAMEALAKARGES